MENIENTNSAGNTTLGDFRTPWKIATDEQFAKLQIFIKVSILIPTLPVSTWETNCGFKFNFSANSSCVVENYELLTSRDKSIIDQMITCLLNTK